MIGIVRVLRVALDHSRELEAVHARHLDVEQDDVGDLLFEHLERIDAVLGGDHGEAFAGQQAAR